MDRLNIQGRDVFKSRSNLRGIILYLIGRNKHCWHSLKYNFSSNSILVIFLKMKTRKYDYVKKVEQSMVGCIEMKNSVK